MSSKLIGVLLIALVAFGAYRVFVYYQGGEQEPTAGSRQASATRSDPSRLPGMSQGLEPSLQAAQRQGPVAFKRWLDAYGSRLQDPRRAWIELDYCTMVARENPREARAVYAAVKERLSTNSPVYPRLKQLERTFD